MAETTPLRPREVVLRPASFAAARSNRHSFARSLLRAASGGDWVVERELFDISENGSGEAVYRIDTGGLELRLVIFSQELDESQRTDRVIAETWDATAALVDGPVDAGRRATMRDEVTVQEEGRAAAGTLVWGRANRSARYFNAVVERLANGLQPNPEAIGDDAYLMRSTAFYGNGKWGLLDFDGYDETHPMFVPYRAQILAAWLFREFSLDLVEHIAATRNSGAAALNEEWRRFFGLGNATGLGLVPYVFHHPAVFDRWITIRETARAHAIDANVHATVNGAARIAALLQRAIQHFSERDSLSCAPYPTCPQVADDVRELSNRIASGGSMSSADAMQIAESISNEAAAVLETVLVELDESLDDELEVMLRANEPTWGGTAAACGHLMKTLDEHYGWVDEFDFSREVETAKFWLMSQNSLEPRRGDRATDEGASNELAIGIARDVASLRAALADADSDTPAWQFTIEHPEHAFAVDRVLAVSALRYGEPHVNALSGEFMPLDLQRVQLAMYGMENFSPQSTDWLRVTLFSGAPRARDVAAGTADGWLFPTKPTTTKDSS